MKLLQLAQAKVYNLQKQVSDLKAERKNLKGWLTVAQKSSRENIERCIQLEAENSKLKRDSDLLCTTIQKMTTKDENENNNIFPLKWVARDQDGGLFLFGESAIHKEDGQWFCDNESFFAHLGSDRYFPNTNWQDKEPTQVRIVTEEWFQNKNIALSK